MEIRINKEKKQFTIIGNVTAKELCECIQEYSLQEYTMIPHVEVQVVKELVKDWFPKDKDLNPFPKIFSQEDRYRGKPLIQTQVITKELEQMMEERQERLLNALLGIDKPKEE